MKQFHSWQKEKKDRSLFFLQVLPCVDLTSEPTAVTLLPAWEWRQSQETAKDRDFKKPNSFSQLWIPSYLWASWCEISIFPNYFCYLSCWLLQDKASDTEASKKITKAWWTLL